MRMQSILCEAERLLWTKHKVALSRHLTIKAATLLSAILLRLLACAAAPGGHTQPGWASRAACHGCGPAGVRLAGWQHASRTAQHAWPCRQDWPAANLPLISSTCCTRLQAGGGLTVNMPQATGFITNKQDCKDSETHHERASVLTGRQHLDAEQHQRAQHQQRQHHGPGPGICLGLHGTPGPAGGNGLACRPGLRRFVT